MSRGKAIARSRMLRTLLVLVIASVVGRLVGKRMTIGDEESDEFRVAAFGDGKELRSHAASLRAGSAMAVMGGADIDLTDATLDPSGATLDVTAVLGGVQVTVPPDWEVRVQSRGAMGGVDTHLTDPDDVPAGAPALQLTTNTWLGGVEITDGRH